MLNVEGSRVDSVGIGILFGGDLVFIDCECIICFEEAFILVWFCAGQLWMIYYII